MITLALLIAAFVVFIIASLGVNVPRVQLIPVGLALWVLATILAGKSF